MHEIGDPYFSEIASGVLRVASEEGLTVQICHTGRDPDTELRQVRNLVTNRVGAILIAGSGFVDPEVEAPVRDELEQLREDGGRVAVIGRHHLRADTIQPDNTEGGRLIAEHVLGLGHRRLALAVRISGADHRGRPAWGVHEAMRAAGVDPADVPVVEDGVHPRRRPRRRPRGSSTSTPRPRQSWR